MFRLRPVSSIAPAAAGSSIGGAAHATAGATTSAKPATMNPACREMRFIADLLGACRAFSHGKPTRQQGTHHDGNVAGATVAQDVRRGKIWIAGEAAVICSTAA